MLREKNENVSIDIQYFPESMAKQIVIQYVKLNDKFIKTFLLNGKCIGEVDNNFLSILNKDKESDLDNFVKSKDFISVNGTNWIRIIEIFSFLNEDGIDRLFSVYVMKGFSVSEMMDLSKTYEKIYKVLWENN